MSRDGIVNKELATQHENLSSEGQPSYKKLGGIAVLSIPRPGEAEARGFLSQPGQSMSSKFSENLLQKIRWEIPDVNL